MNTTLCIALLALAPQELPRSASAPSLQAPAATQQDVPFLADLPLLGEMFQAQAPVPDPDLRWNGATEDVYRRALHQRDVRGNYAEAVRLLLSIADSDQVIQIPGQASWVLGQAALALSMDGRTDEAEKMLPGIRNGSAGTDLEPQVGVLLDRIASYRGGNQELDETFRVYLWERLQEFPRDDKDRGSDIRDYGRLTLPYLEQIVSGQLRMGASGFGQGDIAQVQKAMRFALAVADAGFVDRTLALLREFPPLTTRVVLPASPPPAMDDQAASAQARLYVHLAEESDAARREVGMEGVLRVAERSGEDTAIRFLEGVLQQSGDARRAWILASLREGTIYRDAAWIDFVAQVASGSDFESREAARWGMVGEAHRAAELRSFAATSDSTRADKLRFLMQFCKPDEDADDRRNALEGLASAALKSVGAYVARPFGWSKRRVEDPIDKGLVVGFSGDSDPGVAATAAYAVSVANDDVLVDAIFPILDAATRTALLASERSWDFSRETALALLELAVAGSTEARTLLSRGNFAHLRVAEMQSAAIDWTGEEWERYAQGRFQRTSESYNQADLADLLAAPGGFPQARAYAVDRGLAVPRELVLRGLEGVDGWDFKAGKPDSWKNLLALVAGRIRFDDTGNGNSEPMGALGEALVRRTWSVCAESGWSLTDLSVDEITHFQWETEPERALGLAMELVTDAESLARYREGWSPGMDTGGLKQKFLAYCLERGWWPTEGRAAKVEPWLEPEQAEFVEVMRLLLSPDRDPAQALSMLEYLPATRRQLESEMARYWQDPDLAYRMVDVYDETAELKEKVPQMLATWQLPDLLGRAQVLAAMASTLDERVVPVLLEALGDPDQDVAGVARKGLERLREVREQREYWEAWEATGSSLSPVVALLQKLKSDNRTVRLAAIRSLGTMGAEEALPFLVDLLEDDDADVRAAAAAALEKING